MEVFRTDYYYIFIKNDKSLWWNRNNGEFTIKSGWDLSSVDDIECVGTTPGIIGRLNLPGVYESHLMVIKESTPIGILYPPHKVFKIKSICLLGSEDSEDVLLPCPRHATGKITTAKESGSSNKGMFEGNILVTRTWGAVKSAGSSIKSTTQQAAAMASSQVKSTVRRKDPGRIEKRVTEELHKIFDDTDSFYYSEGGDLTCTLQKQGLGITDDRFFWNKHMLEDVIKLNDPFWVLPVIQGFVQLERCSTGNSGETFILALISRRSRYRAGTRYKRRGVDETGHVANYVETEQILSLQEHQMSFTIVRGSVPVYWSQPGYKYRPPPRIDKGEAETQVAFEKHFETQLSIYGPICIINLVEQGGKEGIIWESFNKHILSYNDPRLTYVTFDFHEYCRGMHFENVSILLNALVEEVNEMGFCWKDPRGMICSQRSVFRVNCMDCLDRTNVVQTALGKAVLESQLSKLGLIPPGAPAPAPLRAPFQRLWANNGDVISRQYAGTNALKGDYTRTGERKFTGIMKDGMNSANRYLIQHFSDEFRQCCIDLCQGHLTHDAQQMSKYLDLEYHVSTIFGIIGEIVPERPPSYFNHSALEVEFNMADMVYQISRYYLSRFKDSYRQATIDLMLGNHVSAESLTALGGEGGGSESENEAAAEHARLLVEDCRRLLLGENQLPLGAWGLIDANPSTGDPNETEVDCILLLTSDFYLVAEYDLHLDKVTRFEKVPLNCVTLIELGTAPPRSSMGALGSRSGVFKSAPICLRISYQSDGVDGFYHMFRSPNLRFFNNVAVVIKTKEEVLESFTAICECFLVACEAGGLPKVPVVSGAPLERRKAPPAFLALPNNGMPRNLSESQLLSIGSKALSNMSEQFSKLGQSLSTKTSKKSKTSKPQFSVGQSQIRSEVDGTRKQDGDYSSSDSDGEMNIFQPHMNSEMEQDVSANYENKFLPSVGIVMGDVEITNVLEVKNQMANQSSDVSNLSLCSVMNNVNIHNALFEANSEAQGSKLDGLLPGEGMKRSPTPEIMLNDDEVENGANSMSKINQKFSHSSGEVDKNSPQTPVAAAKTINRSEKDLTLSLSGSQSENALKQLKVLTSPIGGGLSRLAKGVQNIGANLDPRKIAVKGGTNMRFEQMSEEQRKLQEKWMNSKTKLIAL